MVCLGVWCGEGEGWCGKGWCGEGWFGGKVFGVGCVTGYQVIRVIRILAKPIRSNSNLALH